jgi:hypothetical protein
MNTVMQTKMRPTVLFDPKNSQHREWALQFLEQRSWQGCPVMFALPQSEPNVYTMITRELSLYYLQQEFRTLCPVVKIQQKYLVKNG